MTETPKNEETYQSSFTDPGNLFDYDHGIMTSDSWKKVWGALPHDRLPGNEEFKLWADVDPSKLRFTPKVPYDPSSKK